MLRERLGVQCLLGLTATATLSTALDIARHLDISDRDGIAVRSAAVPPNLHLSVSMDREKDQVRRRLVKGGRWVYSLTAALCAAAGLTFAGVGVAAERRTLRLPGLHHRVLHQERGDGSRGGPSQDLPAGRVGEREQADQQQPGTRQPSGAEEKRLG